MSLITQELGNMRRFEVFDLIRQVEMETG